MSGICYKVDPPDSALDVRSLDPPGVVATPACEVCSHEEHDAGKLAQECLHKVLCMAEQDWGCARARCIDGSRRIPVRLTAKENSFARFTLRLQQCCGESLALRRAF